MAKFLQQILDLDEPHFSIGMAQLEKSNGNQGIDARVIADMTHKSHEIMRRLGLNVSDTTGEELYHALKTTIKTGIGQDMLLGLDYVLLPYDGGAVSFNLIDVIENTHHELDYEHRIISHGQRSLRGEIIGRYLQQGPSHQDVTKTIGKEMGLLQESDELYSDDNSNQKQTRGTTVQPFILTIGDIVTDAFIALRQDEAEVTTDEHGQKRLSMEFGSKPPYDRVDIIEAVGNSANAAVSLTRLGLRAGLMAFIGEDQAGKDSLKHLTEEKVDTTTVSVQKGFKSNYHFALRYGADRTILIKYEDYAYDWQQPSIKPDWIYLSMISANSWQLHMDMMKYLEENQDIKLAFQPGTFHFEWGTEKLAAIYKRSYIVFMNREEAALVTGKPLDNVKDLAFALHDLGPQVVVITDGPNGSYVSGDYKFLMMPNYPDPAPPYDRTGAGDAFASTIVAALAHGESLETALRWAPINSMSVVQKLGAQAGLLHPDELQKLVDEAPADYVAKDLTE
jgi:sugar/nucleoside kinase (ribokinase family)